MYNEPENEPEDFDVYEPEGEESYNEKWDRNIFRACFDRLMVFNNMSQETFGIRSGS